MSEPVKVWRYRASDVKCHLLGWFEEMPRIRADVCPVCDAEPGQGHLVQVIGVDQTQSLLRELQP